MRIRCLLFGCESDEFSACPRCDAHQYMCGPVWIERGWLFPITHHWWMFRQWIRRHRLWFYRCNQCGRWMLPFWRYDGWLCSKECFDEWLPF